ncbi:hypothetical protein LCGC14_1993390 [marine sediment metagenome]|uniref:Uncharacterized protein n=1 Tax=marine sediment metagenome TaxID=412755 RepID=A0A0F9FTE5_9ZZZZ
MWFKAFFLNIFRRKSICDKCGSVSLRNSLCNACQTYGDLLKIKRESEIAAKKELERRNWIKTRDEFLNKQND